MLDYFDIRVRGPSGNGDILGCGRMDSCTCQAFGARIPLKNDSFYFETSGRRPFSMGFHFGNDFAIMYSISKQQSL